MSHGNLKHPNIGDYHCPKCKTVGRKQEWRRQCMDCHRTEKRRLQNYWNRSKAEIRNEERLEKKLTKWDTSLALKFTTVSLRANQEQA